MLLELTKEKADSKKDSASQFKGGYSFISLLVGSTTRDVVRIIADSQVRVNHCAIGALARRADPATVYVLDAHQIMI